MQAATAVGALRVVAKEIAVNGPAAVGTFVLSMTRSESDILGVYLLAKYTGNFADAQGVEHCLLPIVPLFETIADLQAAPGIMKGLLQVPEGRQVLPNLSVRENLELGATALSGRTPTYTLQRIHELFPILAQRREQRAGEARARRRQGEGELADVRRDAEGK